MTAEQIEQKKQQLKQLAEEAKQLKDELVEAGAWPLDESELDEAAGGVQAGSILKGGAGEFWDSRKPRKPTKPERPKGPTFL